MTATAAILLAGLVLQPPELNDLPVLQLGDEIEGTIEETDSAVRSATLDSMDMDAPVRGKTYRIERSEPGPFFIELRSHLFDTFLIVRGLNGEVLLEDDDGLLGTHSTIAVSASSPDSVLVDVCALDGGTGPFHLRVAQGEREHRFHYEQQEAALADARKSLSATERAFGPDHVRTARSQNSLALLLQDQGEYEEARRLFELALRIVEDELGPDHLSTATRLNNLAMLLQDQGAFEEARPLFERALRIREESLGPDHPETSVSLNNLAMLRYYHGDYEEAYSLFERAFRIDEAVLGPDHLSTATSVSNLASLLVVQGDYEAARPLYERALQIREAALGREHPSIATILNNLASLLQDQGAYEAARPLYERALRIREAALGPDHPSTATSLNNLAMLLQDQGAFEEAQLLHERALRIKEAVLGPDHPSTATSVGNLASLLLAQGAYGEARPLCERALRIREAALGPDHPDIATSLRDLASLHYCQGAYEDARPLYERSLRINEAAFGADHPETANSLSNLAVVLKSLGAYSEARPLYERALRIDEAVFGAGHIGTSKILNNLASLLLVQGANEDARLLFERALRIVEVELGPDHLSTATSLNNLASLHYHQGSYEDARLLYEQALRVREAALGSDHPDIASSLSNLGLLLHVQGAYEDARPLYERALKMRESALGSSHPDIATCLVNLGILLHGQGAYEEARPLLERGLRITEVAFGPGHPATALALSNLALVDFDLGELETALVRSEAAYAISTSHIEHELWSLSEAERLRLIRTNNWFRDILLSLTRTMEETRKRAASYEVVMTSKGRVKRSLLRDGLREVRSLPKAERELVTRLRALQTQLSDALYATEIADAPSHARKLRELRSYQNKLEVDLARLRRSNEETEESPSVRGVQVSALLSALPKGAAAVDFLVHEWYEPGYRERREFVRDGRWTPPHLSAWVMRAGQPVQQFDLGAAGVVEEAVRRFLEEMVLRRGVAVPIEANRLATARNDALRTLLWEPLAEAIGDAHTVFVSGDSFLGTLPFETLQREDGSFLIEHHEFAYLADLQSLADVTPTVESRPPQLFAAGGIEYWARAALIDPVSALTHADRRARVSRTWPALAWTGPEVTAVAGLHRQKLGEGAMQLVLMGQDATEERVKRSLSGFTHVHLATHGYFHPEGLPSAWKILRNQEDKMGRMLVRDAEQRVVGFLPGLLSGLVFAGANAKPEPGRDNGLLTAEEITYLDLKECELVVLSACETGLGRAEGGEGMIGLRRAFRMAGARTVISSLWEVSDAATQDLMTLFYENLWLRGLPKLEALRRAQLSMLEHNRELHGHGMPFTWGAFVLDGAPQ